MAPDNLRPDRADDRPTPGLHRDRNAEGRPENARPRDRYGAPLPREAVDEMPDRVEPEDVCTSVEQARHAAAELFAEQRFFEAHEFFEWAWKGPLTEDADRDFYKGMAQLAVGYTHSQRGNATGSQSLLERGIEHVAPYAPTHHGIDVERAMADARAFAEWVRTEGPGTDGPYPDFPDAA